MPDLKIGGYPRDNGKLLTDWHGKIIGRGGKQRACTRVQPGRRGAWISSERCSYYFKVDNAWYSCRGRGDGIAASCRRLKEPPAWSPTLYLGGVRRRKRRR